MVHPLPATPRSGRAPGGGKSYAGRSRRSLGVELTNIGITPGQLTGLRAPTSRGFPKSRNITEHVDPEQIALLVKNEWKLSYVTPLYQFRHVQLKSYSKQLSAFIVSEKQQGIAVEIGLETNFKVVFSVVLGLAETEDDAETVFIQIHSKPPFAGDGDVPKIIWSGWLTCVGGNPDYLRSLPSGFVCLPLFCASGSESLTSLVKLWFERTFDCSFGTLNLNSTYLQWLASMWTGCHHVSSIRYLKLVWNLPAQPPLDISYTVHPQDAWDLWNSVREQDSTGDTIGINEVERFMKGLESHFFRHFRIYLSAGMLTKVSTAFGSAHCDGKIKITSSDFINHVLILLTECALLKMPI
ncbi:centromere protein L-like [Scleropages formosus]|uniref:Centromere protein L n=1 Tax=Scleropages formosus TaxID=113540 RepID=A0A0P7WU96_SCLFO|nr:centromere protein L-like [Scleropages formosus]